MVPTSVLAFFNCATPGLGPWVKYRDFYHKIDDLNLANLWPAGSTPKADLDHADALFDGDQNNLIGIRCFIGSQPIATLVVGPNGSGKSVMVQTLMGQSALRFKYIVVIDDGLSYEATCRRLDPQCRPIVIRSNGTHTFNPFDTGGLPLSPQHLTDATALVHVLVGRALDEDKDKLRQAVISEAIERLYEVAYRRWRKDNPEEHYRLCREAAALLRFRDATLDPNDGASKGVSDIFLEARERRRQDPEALREFEAGIDDDAALSLDRGPATEGFIRSLAFASWTPEMFPTLSDLQDELRAGAAQKGLHQDLSGMLSSLLRPWLRGGRYGPIVDGVSNMDLGSVDIRENDPLKIVYIELGAMGKSEADLKAVVGFLISNHVRNHIQRMPRSVRKQVILEELTSVLGVPNGEKMVIDYAERMRKYQAQLIYVFQQWANILKAYPSAATAMIGGCLALLLLRNNRSDLDAIGQFKPIPEVVKDRILSFPQPEAMRGRADAYAGFVYVQLDGAEPRYTVGRNVISRELEAISSSSGDRFDEKRKEFRKTDARHELSGVGEPA
jgi:hypothetical protein